MPSIETASGRTSEQPFTPELSSSDVKGFTQVDNKLNDATETLPPDQIPRRKVSMEGGKTLCDNLDDGNAMKEWWEQVESESTTKMDEVKPEDDFPDGGLRAWLVVFGVCFLLDLHPVYNIDSGPSGHVQRICDVSFAHKNLGWRAHFYLGSRFGYINSWGVSAFMLQTISLHSCTP